MLLGYGNRLEFFADLLALWTVGACAIPLDARLTPFEIETLARAARAQGFIAMGDVEEVRRGFERIARHGTGADRQRALLSRATSRRAFIAALADAAVPALSVG